MSVATQPRQIATERSAIRVLYSFPHKIGAGRIAETAWQQVAGVAADGVAVRVAPGVVHRPLPAGVRVRPTLARGRLRLPYRVLGRLRTLALHDWIAARRLEQIAGEVDLVHAWPLAAEHTLEAARRLGIPTVLERPNTHTAYAYAAVAAECERIGVELPPGDEHAYQPAVLEREALEYELAFRLLCPSDFVVGTFRDRGFAAARLLRHQYGYDPTRFAPPTALRDARQGGLTAIFVGVCAVRKGLHIALEAWLRSSAHRTGTFLVAGELVPAYADALAPLLGHRSIRVLGHRTDVAELLQASDLFILPSVEEGYPLSVVEARGSGCVPLVSDVAAAACVHDENALVHRVGDVDALTEHLTRLDSDRARLVELRSSSLLTLDDITWAAAGRSLHAAYAAAVAEWRDG